MTSDFAALERKLKRAIDAAHRKGIAAIGNRAVELCPKDTGETASKIVVDPDKGTVSQDWYVGIFLELGTEKMPPHPYLRPAFDENAPKIIKSIKEAINDNLPES